MDSGSQVIDSVFFIGGTGFQSLVESGIQSPGFQIPLLGPKKKNVSKQQKQEF